MKKILKYIPVMLMALCLGFTFVACSDGDTEEEITVKDQLPMEAKSFINSYFIDYEIVKVIKNNDNPVWYEVQFRGGGEIKFDANGRWYEVEGDHNLPLPKGFYPEAIDTYVAANYPNSFIEEMQRDARGYEVDLHNEVDLLFGTTGDFLGIKR